MIRSVARGSLLAGALAIAAGVVSAQGVKTLQAKPPAAPPAPSAAPASTGFCSTADLNTPAKMASFRSILTACYQKFIVGPNGETNWFVSSATDGYFMIIRNREGSGANGRETSYIAWSAILSIDRYSVNGSDQLQIHLVPGA